LPVATAATGRIARAVAARIATAGLVIGATPIPACLPRVATEAVGVATRVAADVPVRAAGLIVTAARIAAEIAGRAAGGSGDIARSIAAGFAATGLAAAATGLAADMRPGAAVIVQTDLGRVAALLTAGSPIKAGHALAIAAGFADVAAVLAADLGGGTAAAIDHRAAGTRITPAIFTSITGFAAEIAACLRGRTAAGDEAGFAIVAAIPIAGCSLAVRARIAPTVGAAIAGVTTEVAACLRRWAAPTAQAGFRLATTIAVAERSVGTGVAAAVFTRLVRIAAIVAADLRVGTTTGAEARFARVATGIVATCTVWTGVAPTVSAPIARIATELATHLRRRAALTVDHRPLGTRIALAVFTPIARVAAEIAACLRGRTAASTQTRFSIIAAIAIARCTDPIWTGIAAPVIAAIAGIAAKIAADLSIRAALAIDQLAIRTGIALAIAADITGITTVLTTGALDRTTFVRPPAIPIAAANLTIGTPAAACEGAGTRFTVAALAVVGPAAAGITNATFAAAGTAITGGLTGSIVPPGELGAIETLVAIGVRGAAVMTGNGAGVAQSNSGEDTANQTARQPFEHAATRRGARERPGEIIEPLSIHPRLSSTTQQPGAPITERRNPDPRERQHQTGQPPGVITPSDRGAHGPGWASSDESNGDDMSNSDTTRDDGGRYQSGGSLSIRSLLFISMRQILPGESDSR
jgi:hypothetical protein